MLRAPRYSGSVSASSSVTGRAKVRRLGVRHAPQRQAEFGRGGEASCSSKRRIDYGRSCLQGNRTCRNQHRLLGASDGCRDQSCSQDPPRPQSCRGRKARCAAQERQDRSVQITDQRLVQVRGRRLIAPPFFERGRRRRRLLGEPTPPSCSVPTRPFSRLVSL